MTRLASVPGVRAAVADRSFAVDLRDSSGRVLGDAEREPAAGHGWSSSRLTPLALRTGTEPQGAGDVVVSGALAAAVHVGDRVRIVTAADRG